MPPPTQDSFSFPITSEEMEGEITNSKAGKAVGLSSIVASVFKILKGALSEP